MHRFNETQNDMERLSARFSKVGGEKEHDDDTMTALSFDISHNTPAPKEVKHYCFNSTA